MNYIENNFYPSWIPEEFRDTIDLTELAVPNHHIIREANKLMRNHKINIAIYRKNNYQQKEGFKSICSIFKTAAIDINIQESIFNAERTLDNCVVVAYSNPIELHQYSN